MPEIEGPKTLEEALKVIRSLKKLVENVKSQRDCLMCVVNMSGFSLLVQCKQASLDPNAYILEVSLFTAGPSLSL